MARDSSPGRPCSAAAPAILALAMLASWGTIAKAQGRLLTITGGPANGTVVSSPAGISCTITNGVPSNGCNATFANNQVVTLTATAAPGDFIFTFWQGDCSSFGSLATCQLTMNANKSAFATFHPSVNLTVTGAGNGSGRVTSTDESIDCTITAGATSGICSVKRVRDFFTIGLIATPGEGSTFGGWAGDCSGTEECIVFMDTSRTVAAAFASPNPSTLTIAGAGSGSGHVTSTPAGINCAVTSGSAGGPGCASSFPSGTIVTLAATPASGSAFVGFSGGCSGRTACSVTMSEARTVTATFALASVAIRVTAAGAGAGRVTSTPAGIDCLLDGSLTTGACSAPFPIGESLTLEADPTGGSTFAGWTGLCSGVSSCVVTVSTAGDVGASFAPPPSVAAVVARLLGTGTLLAEQERQLDRFGNADGDLDVGDLLALIDRTGGSLGASVRQTLLQMESRASGPVHPPAARRVKP